MPSTLGSYDHVNASDPVSIPLNLDEFASLLVRSNYGVHRLLSALVRARPSQDDRLMTEIRKLLEEGYF